MTGLYDWYSSLSYNWFAYIDYIEAIFWSLTYVLIIYTAAINKKDPRFPISPTTLFINFAWETASVVIYIINTGFLYTRAGFIRFLWLFFDIFIVILYYYKYNKHKQLKTFVLYCIFYSFLAVGFFLCFQINYAMVISAFIIDAHMELLFWKNRKKLDPSNRLIIGIFKLLGDFFAGMYYARSLYIVLILAMIALVLDILYIIYAIDEQRKHPEIKKNFHNELMILYRGIKRKLLPEKTYQKQRTYKKKTKTKKTHRK